MKMQEFLMGSLALGPFLASMLASREREVEGKRWQSQGNDPPTVDGMKSRGTKDVPEAHSAGARVVTLGPMLTLLLTLRSQVPGCNRPSSREMSLPHGCLLAVHYSSR